MKTIDTTVIKYIIYEKKWLELYVIIYKRYIMFYGRAILSYTYTIP